MWYHLKNVSSLLTPALIIHLDGAKQNISEMIRIAGAASRLRPNVKTIKNAELVALQMSQDITKFKCATLMEAKMLASCGVKDVLWAYPIVGPNQEAFLALQRKYPETSFSVLIDDLAQLDEWDQKLRGSHLNLFIDINVGMNRTGIVLEEVTDLISSIDKNPLLTIKGFHAYDGHNHESDLNKRTAQVTKEFEKIGQLIRSFERRSPLELICGGSITFPVHAKYPSRMLSPGTSLLWDAGYSHHFPDLKFEVAAVLMTRIISKPAPHLICLDLGHKAVASEMKTPPVVFPELKNYHWVSQSEEHLILEVESSDNLKVGAVLFGIPWHICPTVALHEKILVVAQQEVVASWKIESRKRTYQL